jgi:hypothetical protein
MYTFRSYATILTLFFTFFAQALFAQIPDWVWNKTNTTGNGSSAKAVAVARNGDIIVAGDFSLGSLCFGGDTLYGFNGSIFLVRFNSSGQLVWFKQTARGTCNLMGMTLDRDDNIAITGSFTGVNLGFGSTLLRLTGTKDVFVAKLDGLGNSLWAKSATSVGGAEGVAICADPSGNIGITGNFTDDVTFGTTRLTRMPGSLIDVFTVKYSPAGAVLWAKSAGSPYVYDHSAGITADPSGNFIITGDFQGQMGFGGGVSITTTTDIAVFLAKYNATGTIQWARKAGGTGGESDGKSVATDAAGNVFVTGYYYCYPAMTIGAFSLPNRGNVDVFVAKYNAAGTPLWAKSGGGNDNDVPNKITTDTAGNAYLAGDYASYDAKFDTFTLKMSLGSGNTSFFVTKYDGAGVVKWVKTGGHNSSSIAFAADVATNSCNEVYIAGFYTGILTLPPTPPLSFASSGNLFVSKIGNVNASINQPLCYGDNTGSATVNLNIGNGPFTYLWSTGGTSATETGLGIGTYTVTVTDANGCVNQSLVSISSKSDMSATFMISGFKCSGPCAGIITANPTKGFSPYTYLWDANAGAQTNAAAANLCPGSYNVRITDSMNCAKSFSVTAVPTASSFLPISVLNIASVDAATLDPVIAPYFRYDVPATIARNTDNPNNFLNAGKNVRLKVKGLNRTPDRTVYPGGQISARTNSPFLTVTDSITGFNPINYGDSAWTIDELELGINATAPPGTMAYFDVVTYFDASQYTTCVGIPVAPLVLARQNDTTVTDDNTGNSIGNGNHYCEYNEVIEFKPLIHNLAPRDASFVTSTFENLDAQTNISIWDGPTGVPGEVYNKTWWNFGTTPNPIAPGQQNVVPTNNFTFGYNKSVPSDNLLLYTVFTAGMRLFNGLNTRTAPHRWAIPFEFNSTHVGLNNVATQQEVTIAPNPSSGHFTITLPAQEGRCTITDVTGRIVLVKDFKGAAIDIDLNAANGLYLAQITNTANGSSVVKKFVLQR